MHDSRVHRHARKPPERAHLRLCVCPHVRRRILRRPHREPRVLQSGVLRRGYDRLHYPYSITQRGAVVFRDLPGCCGDLPDRGEFDVSNCDISYL